MVTNLYMEFFKGLIEPSRPRLWKRYVDDIFFILRRGTAEHPQPPEGIRPTIKFTVEWKKMGPFLSFPGHSGQEEGGWRFGHHCLQNPTHTDRYLHFQSHHPAHVKRGLVKCLHDRAKGIMSSQDKLQKEVDHLAMESPLAEWLSCQLHPQHLCPTPPPCRYWTPV